MNANSHKSINKSTLFCMDFTALQMVPAVLPVHVQQPVVSINTLEWVEGTKIPVQWSLMDDNATGVIFNLGGVTGINGSGQLPGIGLEVTGNRDTTLDIDISNELLVNTQANKISADWRVNTKTGVHQSTPVYRAVFALFGLTAVLCLAKFSRRP